MELELTAGQIALRDEIREFLAKSLPEDLAHKVYSGHKITKAEHVEWQRVVSRKSWLGLSWPKEHGGPGWDPFERYVFDQESNLACMPRANLLATDLLGPVLVRFGTEEQKSRFLPRILSSEDWWCQGFSESGAGSDLAALSTRARREGDVYVINGTKLWTSYAHEANWMFCLARTSDEQRKQAGISFLLLPMDDPGVSVTPIITAGGVHVVNQVNLDDVRVPVSYLVGAEGQGWDITRFLLANERIMGAWIGSSSRYLEQLKALAESKCSDGRSLANQRFRDRVSLLEIDLMSLKFTAFRVMADELAGRTPGPEVSVLKLKGSEIQQSLTELLFETAGMSGMVDPLTMPDGLDTTLPEDQLYLAQQYFDRRKLTIYGGSAEIQKNIIAQRILGI